MEGGDSEVGNMNLSTFLSNATLVGRVLPILSSTTLTIPISGKYKIYAWGGGGSGAAAVRTGSSNAKAYATGGGSGAVCIVERKLIQGDVLASVS